MGDVTGEFTANTNGPYGIVTETVDVGNIFVTNKSLSTAPNSTVEVQVEGNPHWYPADGTDGFGFQLQVGQSANIRAMQNGQEAVHCIVLTGGSENEVSFQFDWDSTLGYPSVNAEAQETSISGE